MHQNRKKTPKTVKNSLKKKNPPKTHEKTSKTRLKTLKTVEITAKAI